MIENEKYKDILDNGLLLDHYLVLCNMKNGVELLETKRVQGFVNLLVKKGYIQDEVLTEKGLEIVSNCEFNIPTTQAAEQMTDFGALAQSIHKSCVNRIYKLTGAKQVRPKLDKKSFPFLPNFTDFAKVLHKVIVTYKLKDMEKVEKTLLNYIEKCSSANNWFPIMQYYIMKNGVSQLVTDIDSEEEEVVGKRSSQKFV